MYLCQGVVKATKWEGNKEGKVLAFWVRVSCKSTRVDACPSLDATPFNATQPVFFRVLACRTSNSKRALTNRDSIPTLSHSNFISPGLSTMRALYGALLS